MKWLLYLVFCTSALAADYYVSTTGSDGNEGTLASPFATLEKARDSAASGDTVYLLSGIHYRTNPFTLVYTNSGVTYRGNSGAILNGSKPIATWGTYSGSIQVSDVSTQGVVSVNQLYFQDARQRKARFPNFTGIRTNSFNLVEDEGGGSATHIHFGAGDLPVEYSEPTRLEVDVWGSQVYSGSVIGTVSAIDYDARTISFSPSLSSTPPEFARYFVQGGFEDLDTAGEWWVDSTNKFLYFWTSNTISTVYAAYATNLIEIYSGCSNITIRNLVLEDSQGSAIRMTNCANITIGANTIRNVGDYNYLNPAVWIGTGTNCQLLGNNIYNTGAGAVWVYGGTTATLLPSNHRLDNNWIYGIGQLAKGSLGGTAVIMYDPSGDNNVGISVTRNTIERVAHNGIYFDGQNHTIAANVISDTMLEADDGGAIYCGAQTWEGHWGTAIVNNYIANARGFGWYNAASARLVNGYGDPCTTPGIYLDFLALDVDVVSNIVVNCSLAGTYLNSGIGNYVQNNIFYLDQASVLPASDTAGMYVVGRDTSDSRWTSAYATMQSRWAAKNPAIWTFTGWSLAPSNLTSSIVLSNWFTQNIVVNTNAPDWSHGVGYVGIYGCNETDNHFRSNVYYFSTAESTFAYTNSAHIEWGPWTNSTGFDASSADADPKLSTTTWQVAGDSPALALGFQQISTNICGLYNDGIWRLAPSATATTLRVGNMRSAP